MAVTGAFEALAAEGGKSMGVYVARPESAGPHAALVVIQEIFGVNDHMQDVTRRFAEQGYVAACPEHYYRLEERTISHSDLQGAFAMRNTLSDDMIIDDLGVVVNFLKQDKDVDPNRIGIIGYCFGGRVSYLAAARMDDFAAASIYYGSGIVGGEINERTPVEPVTLASQVKCPVQGVWGAEDHAIPVEDVHQLEEALKAASVEVDFRIYDGAGHAFFCDARPSYHAEASADVWPRTLAFFGKHL